MKCEISVKMDTLPTERIALVAWRLAQGNAYTAREVADMTGLTWFGAHRLLCKVSRTLPIYSDGGKWQRLP